MVQAVIHLIQLPKVIALIAEIGKLGVSKFVNVASRLNDLKTKVDDLDIDKLETVPVDLKKLSDVVSIKKFLKTQTSTN